MTNVFEIDAAAAGNGSDFLGSMSYVTLLLSIIPFAIFVWLAIRSKSIKAFQFQISIFIAVYILGEIIENSRFSALSGLSSEVGPQIHVGSAIFFTIMIWLRFYHAGRNTRRMVESDVNDNGG
ncbi:MAG TPA: hypothetical protein VJ729_03285 [Nitrososphaeraceae archaeon]|jgi:D-alanyl-lipoteichoic acid acyltransferase DltB (MBOAT superfamily)|nr:hypothetical protein [Nitrososphaeraceae archaeon]